VIKKIHAKVQQTRYVKLLMWTQWQWKHLKGENAGLLDT